MHEIIDWSGRLSFAVCLERGESGGEAITEEGEEDDKKVLAGSALWSEKDSDPLGGRREPRGGQSNVNNGAVGS